MAYTPSTQLATLELFQWSRPDAPNPRIASPIDDTSNVIVVSAPPLDFEGNPHTGNFLMGIKNERGYTETCYVPNGTLNYDAQTVDFTVGQIILGGTSGAVGVVVADTDNGTTGTLTLGSITGTFQDNESISGSALVNGTLNNSMSVDGLTASNVVRGIRLSGLDFFTSDPTLAADHGQNSGIFCNISAVNFLMMVATQHGEADSGGNTWRIGRGIDENIDVIAANGDLNRPRWRYNATGAGTGQWEYTNNGVDFFPFGDGSGLMSGDGLQIISGTISVDLDANSGLEFNSGDLRVASGIIQDNEWTYQGTDTGVADAYAIALTPTITAYAEGQEFTFKAANANTGASTLAVDGLATLSIKKNGNVDLAADDIKDGQEVTVVYDGTDLQMTSHLGNEAGGVNIAIGTGFWSPSASGQTMIVTHNLGMIPSLIKINYGAQTTNGRAGFGLYDGTTHRLLYSALSGSNFWVTSTTRIIILIDGTTFLWDASITDVTSTTFTMTVQSHTSNGSANFTWEVM